MGLGAKFGWRENGRVELEDLAQFAKFVFSALPPERSGGEGDGSIIQIALETDRFDCRERIVLTKSETSAILIFLSGIYSPGRSPAGVLLFENLPDHNPSREL